MSQNARNPKIGVVIVLYRQSLDRCPSYRSLGFPANDSFLILCDNSPQPQPVPPSAAYIHNPHNPGVSAAYNQAARLALQKDCTHMLLAD